MSVVLSDSSSYLVQNKKLIKPKRFKVIFSVQYTGEAVPVGTCSDLEALTSKLQVKQILTFTKSLVYA